MDQNENNNATVFFIIYNAIGTFINYIRKEKTISRKNC